MPNDELRDQISRIETDIEDYAITLDGCRKAMLLSKVAIGAGIISLSAYLLGAISLNAVAVIGAMAAVIGGVVVFGSNLTTSNQATSAMAALEKRRAELIDMIHLRTVGEGDELPSRPPSGGVSLHRESGHVQCK
jgi:hypothetical protein